MEKPEFISIDDDLEIDGFTITATIRHDPDMGAPWDEHDGHGPVCDGTKDPKLPGQLVLSREGGGYAPPRFRYYDFAEACRIARRDGWDSAPYNTGQETKRQQAAKAARADFERLRAWCNDQWHWCGVVVTVSKEGIELGSASLWGIESDAGDYLTEVANELLDEAMNEARAKLARLAA